MVQKISDNRFSVNFGSVIAHLYLFGDAVSNKAIVIPAVEVEPPGCSYNPTSESHQDSLAQAVADEMQKVYTKELRPAPVPLTVEGGVIDEEDVDVFSRCG
ncbi:putative ribosome biogenesis protein Nop53/GLTSCR2 [Helianthus annuus]|nr:putative ribosome biogenesis protein Nop53/GLTSCR2 [Helianthus annuus]